LPDRGDPGGDGVHGERALAHPGHDQETKETVETNVATVAKQLDSPPKDNKITSPRYFTVSLGGRSR